MSLQRDPQPKRQHHKLLCLALNWKVSNVRTQCCSFYFSCCQAGSACCCELPFSVLHIFSIAKLITKYILTLFLYRIRDVSYHTRGHISVFTHLRGAAPTLRRLSSTSGRYFPIRIIAGLIILANPPIEYSPSNSPPTPFLSVSSGCERQNN